jgi:uncharacterized protein YbjT (DUF2867 family)
MAILRDLAHPDETSEWTGVLGASCLVGRFVLPSLAENAIRVLAVSRSQSCEDQPDVSWQAAGTLCKRTDIRVPNWLCLAPIWVVPDYFAEFERLGARRVVALSSTSRFTKPDSSDASERDIAWRLIDGERQFEQWAEGCGVEWVILRPTLIYGLGLDRNVSDVARFIRRFGFFPVIGSASGLRQPLHASDLADACVAALTTTEVHSGAYNLSGGEALTYREMVARVFAALGRSARIVRLPASAVQRALALASRLPGHRHWSPSIAERMNHDQVFDHADAARDLGFAPRAFLPGPSDFPPE